MKQKRKTWAFCQGPKHSALLARTSSGKTSRLRCLRCNVDGPGYRESLGNFKATSRDVGRRVCYAPIGHVGEAIPGRITAVNGDRVSVQYGSSVQANHQSSLRWMEPF